MAQILKRAAKYKQVSTVLYEGEAHLRDPYTPAPQILKPPPPRETESPDDVTDFPRQMTVPLPEAIPYAEGRYRPPSIPLNSGYWPYNTYLQRGKVYMWCSCGVAQNGPFCDGFCNHIVTRNRPIYFNVNESGYYKMCQCKMSANAPFCNNTHRDVIKYHLKTYRGFYEGFGQVLFYGGSLFMLWNFYT